MKADKRRWATATVMPCPPSAISRLDLVYAELDARVEDVLAKAHGACRACGTCCTFQEGAPVLYATALEREYLAFVPPGEQDRLADGACPYLDTGTERCTARERRTVGCRTHFCATALPDKGAREAALGLAEQALAEIRRIVVGHGLDWDYAPVVVRLAGRVAGRAGSP